MKVINRLPKREYDNDALTNTTTAPAPLKEPDPPLIEDSPGMPAELEEFMPAAEDSAPTPDRKPMRLPRPSQDDPELDSKRRWLTKIERALNSKRFGEVVAPYRNEAYESFDVEDLRIVYADIQYEMERSIKGMELEEKVRSYLRAIEHFAPAVGINASGLTDEMMEDETVAASIEQYDIDSEFQFEGPVNRLISSLAYRLANRLDTPTQSSSLASKINRLTKKEKSEEFSQLQNELDG